jgi:predicted nuclease of predicted toxin-antitoxin system
MMAVRLKVDENLPSEIADLLKGCGYDAVTVRDQGWSGTADPDLWQWVQSEGRLLITADKDFADARVFRPGTHAGVILLRADEENLFNYLDLAAQLVSAVNLGEITGSIVVVTPRGIRVRR